MTNADRGDAFFLHDFFSDFNGGLNNGFVIDDQGMSGTTRMSGVERILGGDGDDVIDLTSPDYAANNIQLFGDQGNDILWGSDGNDLIDGGSGLDSMAGGLGEDIFVTRLGQGATSYAQADVIKDFNIGVDKISLAGGLTFESLEFDYSNDFGGIFVSDGDENHYVLLEGLCPSLRTDFLFVSSHDLDDEIVLVGSFVRPDHFSGSDQPDSLPVDANINVTWFFGQWNWTAFDSSALPSLTLEQFHVGKL